MKENCIVWIVLSVVLMLLLFMSSIKHTRLMEFEKTDSSKLTIEEFDTKHIDLEQEMDPPCYTEGLRKAKLAQVRLRLFIRVWPEAYCFCPVRPCMLASVCASRNIVNTMSCRVFHTFSQNLHQ